MPARRTASAFAPTAISRSPSRVRVRKIVPTRNTTATMNTGAGMPGKRLAGLADPEVAVGAHELELGQPGEGVAAGHHRRQAGEHRQGADGDDDRVEAAQRDEAVDQADGHADAEPGQQAEPGRVPVGEQPAADAAGERRRTGQGQVEDPRHDADADPGREQGGERTRVRDQDGVVHLEEERRAPDREDQDQHPPQHEDAAVAQEHQHRDRARDVVPGGDRGRGGRAPASVTSGLTSELVVMVSRPPSRLPAGR